MKKFTRNIPIRGEEFLSLILIPENSIRNIKFLP